MKITDDMLTELLPCPFCGSRHIEIRADAYAHCHACFSDGPLMTNGAEAAAAWNGRTTLGSDPWQPIETAPKGGTVVMLWLRSPWSEVRIAHWAEPWKNWQPQGGFPDKSSGIGSLIPTHWMPLPAAPNGGKGEGS